MKKMLLTIVLATLCLNFNANAQFYKPSHKTVRMGETLPDSFYQTVHQAVNAKTGELTTLKLSKYKDKLVILDFWATWCGPCIYSLNKLDSIKTILNNDDFIIIPVTYQRGKEALPVLNKFRWNMTSIAADTTLSQIFPTEGIPHQVWVKDGKVIAVPKWDNVNAENILKTLSGQSTNMVMNNFDRLIDPSKPLFPSSGLIDSNIVFQSVLAKEIPSVNRLPLQINLSENGTVLTVLNQNIRDLYYEAFKSEIHPLLTGKEGSGVFWKVGDSLRSRLKEPVVRYNEDQKYDAERLQWRNHNIYTYQFYSPLKVSEKDAIKIMQQDINTYFGRNLGITAGIEPSIKKVATLTVAHSIEDTAKLLKNKGEKRGGKITDTHRILKNTDFSTLVSLIQNLVPDRILMNQTTIPKDFRIDFSWPLSVNTGATEIRKLLRNYGLEIKLGQLETPVLVVRSQTVRTF